MTDVPILEKWSSEVANDDARDNALAADEAKTEAEIRHARSLQSTGGTRQERAEMIAAGKTPAPSSELDLKAMISHLGDIRLARDLHSKKASETRQREGRRLCATLNPSYGSSAKRFSEALVAAHAALTEMTALESKLRAQGIGYYPIVCNVNAEKVFGWPTDRSSDLARLLRECVQFGHLKAMPKELA